MTRQVDSTRSQPLSAWLTPKWIARQLLGRSNRLSGVYSSFSEALARSTYPGGAPITQDLAAAQDVLPGEAHFCRDGIRFLYPPRGLSLSAAAVLAAAAQKKDTTRVLDFGGGAAALYLTHRSLWASIPGLSWNIVEREQLVREAKPIFSGLPINWYTSIKDACADHQPDIVILSSVLQYLNDPSATLHSICGLLPTWLVIDRTPVGANGPDIVAMQKSPRNLHGSSYPSWIFGSNGAVLIPAQAYECLLNQFSDDPVLLHRLRPVIYQGWLYRRVDPTCE